MDVDGDAPVVIVGTPLGKRRWPSAAAASRDDGAFYGFQEWLDFCRGDDAFARDLWARAIGQDMGSECGVSREAQLRAKLAADVGALRLATPEDLAAAAQGIVLELRAAGLDSATPGNSLRVGEEGAADFLGGAGARATFGVEVVAAAPPTLQVRLRSYLGSYLRQRGADLDFGPASEQEGTVFEVLVRDHPAPLVSLGGKGGQVVGTFVPRWAPVACWWREALLQHARDAVKVEEDLQGRRWHPKDPSRGHHTFVEWVEYYDELGWGGLVTNGALVLARHVWTYECFREGDESDGQWCEVNVLTVGGCDGDMDCSPTSPTSRLPDSWHWCPTDAEVRMFRDGVPAA